MKKTILAATVAAGMLVAGAAQADTAIIGQIQAFGLTFCPVGWMPANGALLQISQNMALFSLIGTRYGGNGQSTFALPDLTGGTIGPKAQPLTWCIATQGLYSPSPGRKTPAKTK